MHISWFCCTQIKLYFIGENFGIGCYLLFADFSFFFFYLAVQRRSPFASTAFPNFGNATVIYKTNCSQLIKFLLKKHQRALGNSSQATKPNCFYWQFGGMQHTIRTYNACLPQRITTQDATKLIKAKRNNI